MKLADILDTLNALAKLDPQAVRKLIEYRVKCNEGLANHPTCQVGEHYDVGLLGILNAIVGTRPDGQGLIAAVLEDDGSVTFVSNED